MKKYRLPLLVIVLLSIASLWLANRNKLNPFRLEKNNFAIEDTSAITKFYLSDKFNNSVKLTRGADGKWLANDTFDVNPALIHVMLTTFNSIAVKAPVAKAARNTIITSLASGAVKTEIYQRVYRINLFDKIKLFPHEKLTRVYYVGSATMDNSGSFMLMEGSEDPYVVYIPGFKGFVSPRYSPLIANWKSHQIFNYRVPDIASVQVDYPAQPENSFVISNRNDKEFALTSPDNRPVPAYDTMMLVQYLSFYKNMNFEMLLDDMKTTKYDSIKSQQPMCVVTLVTKTGQKRNVKLWKRKADIGQLDQDGNQMDWDLERAYALVDDKGFMVSVQYFSFNDILVPIRFFFKANDQRK